MVITLSITSILSAAADNLKYAPHNFSVLPPSQRWSRSTDTLISERRSHPGNPTSTCRFMR